jgi:hypothetical protein
MCVLFRWHRRSEKIHFLYGKCGIPSYNVEINCVLCGWRWGPDYCHQFDGNGPSDLPILCSIYGEHRHSAYFHTPGSTSGNSLIYCQARILRRAWLFHWHFIFRLTHRWLWLFPNFGVQSYSTRPPTRPIWEISVNVRGLNLSSHWFSEFHHQAPHMFVRPQILMSRDVFDCDILRYDPAVILMMDLLQPSRFLVFY